MLTPPPSQDERALCSSPPLQRLLENSDELDLSRSTSSSPRFSKMRNTYLGGGFSGGGNLQLSAAAYHPLKSRENSPEHQFQRQGEQSIRPLSPILHRPQTPALGFRSSSPPISTVRSTTSPDGAHTPPTTAMASSLFGGRQFSERSSEFAPSPSPTNLSYEVLSGYSSISPAERIRQHQRETFYHRQREERQFIWERDQSPQADFPVYEGEFRPNADLPFPISEGLRRFYPHAQTHDGLIEERRASIGTSANDYFEKFNNFAVSAKQRFGGSPTKPPYRTDNMMMEEEEDDTQRFLPPPTGRRASSEMQLEDAQSSGRGVTSGIPSYTKEFGMGWPVNPLAENLVHAYIGEIKSQIDLILRRVKRPLCFVLVLGGLGMLISFIVTSLAIPLICGNPSFSQMSHCVHYYHMNQVYYAQQANTTYPDFPTLMSIESSFEKIVDGAAGGTALARAMKSSEMAVSDLSTVVRYSDLKCRETLSEKLDGFATDAKASVRALSGWSSKVGGVLDQLLSINQYSLRELHSLREYEARKGIFSTIMAPFNPILTPLLYRPVSYIASLASLQSDKPPAAPPAVSPGHPRNSPATRAQIAATFNKAAEVLELNLRQLVGDGETIFTSLTHLSEQHKPIYDEIVREVVDIKKEEEVVLSSLWTKMGGNHMKRKNFRDNAKLLEMIGKYEEEARGYVESTVLELDRMMADLEILRRRVAEPLLVTEGGAKPAVHMGVGVGEIPLHVHIDAIEKAVERLVRKRGERRDREDSYLRALIENNERGPRVDILVED